MGITRLPDRPSQDARAVNDLTLEQCRSALACLAGYSPKMFGIVVDFARETPSDRLRRWRNQ